MVDIDFWVPEDEANRFVTMYAPEDMSAPMQGGLIKMDDLFIGFYSKPPVLEAGGGGLVSTVADYGNFCKCSSIRAAGAGRQFRSQTLCS